MPSLMTVLYHDAMFLFILVPIPLSKCTFKSIGPPSPISFWLWFTVTAVTLYTTICFPETDWRLFSFQSEEFLAAFLARQVWW